MRNALLIFFSFISVCLSAQDNPRCEIYQYSGTDSVGKVLAKVITRNSRGQVVTERTINWKTSEQESTPDGTYTYFYNDTLLTKWMYGSDAGDSSRMEFQYDATGKLIRQSFFELKSTGSQSGNFSGDDRPQGAPRRWEQTSLVNYSYDDKGRKILYDATRLHNSPQNMYKWEYDEQNRLTMHQCFSRGRLTWKEDYQYFDWGYRYWRTWYDSEGNMRHEQPQESPQYYPLLFFSCKLDKQGRVFEERITDEKQKLQGRTVTFYDKQGRISKTINYDANDKQSVTHVYSYK